MIQPEIKAGKKKNEKDEGFDIQKHTTVKLAWIQRVTKDVS